MCIRDRYINDLHLAIKHSETFHFADDTHLLCFAKSIRSLCSKVNADLRVLTCWLNANKISLNSSKTEFVLYRSNSKTLESIPFLKLLFSKLCHYIPLKSLVTFIMHYFHLICGMHVRFGVFVIIPLVIAF